MMLSIPYTLLNHFHRLKWRFPRTVVLLSCVGVGWTFYLPFHYHTTVLQEKSFNDNAMPVAVGIIYALLASNYALAYLTQAARLRHWKDTYLVVLAIFCMGFAYYARQHDADWCIHHDAFIQGHALWHVFMSFGVLFFYLFLRQERRVGGEMVGRDWKSRGSSMMGPVVEAKVRGSSGDLQLALGVGESMI